MKKYYIFNDEKNSYWSYDSSIDEWEAFDSRTTDRIDILMPFGYISSSNLWNDINNDNLINMTIKEITEEELFLLRI